MIVSNLQKAKTQHSQYDRRQEDQMTTIRMAKRHRLPHHTLRDQDIREALVKKRLTRYTSKSDTIIIHELGLAHAKSRIDVATINGTIHGFEIKSTHDSLNRFPKQLEIYCKALQKLTLVVATRHIKRIYEMVPFWCGIIEVDTGPRGGILFHHLREPKRNPSLDLFILAHLLWRDEAKTILAVRGASKLELRAPRAELYRMLIADVTERELMKLIKSSMMQRQAWRDQLRPS